MSVFDALLRAKSLQPVSTMQSGWYPWIREPYTGAWQRNDEWSVDTILAFHAVYACITLIASDIGKLRQRLLKRDNNLIWSENSNTAHSPVLRKPNRFQNHIQFKEWWITSKLMRGNTYALKERDASGIVRALYLLDPNRVTVLVSPDGSVLYRLSSDNLAGLEERQVTIPASEIIHDRMNCLFHPLVGVSPIFACGAAANIGLSIQSNSNGFFSNGSTPGGILTAPGAISPETAQELKEYWENNYAGDNTGKIAVLGDGLTYAPMRMTAVDSQLIEQLRWTAEVACSAFHVPPFKIGLGTMPTYQNAEILNQIYYSDCLQSLIEQYEACMDEGLGLDGVSVGMDLDLDGLLRMDSATQVKTLSEGIKGALLTPNEARLKIDKPPLDGGDTIYLQQQYYSLEALAERDANDPFSSQGSTPTQLPDQTNEAAAAVGRQIAEIFERPA